MKYTNVKLNKILILFALIAVFSVLGITVAASEELDPNRTGSISISFIDSTTNNPVSGGNVTIYHIAEISETDIGYNYVFTENFTDCELPLDDLESNTFLADLNSYISDNNISGISVTVDNTGKCLYSDLSLGVYLVVQNQAATGYYTIENFIVTIPMTDNNGYIYNIDATPKMEQVKPIPESSSTPPSPPSSSTPTINDDVNGTDDEKLPQTGQLNWPIPVLAGAGILLFFLGWALTHSRKKKNV